MRDGRAAIEMVAAAWRSAELHRPVRLDEWRGRRWVPGGDDAASRVRG